MTGGTILLLEDDERIQRLCRRLLEPKGLSLTVAGSVAEALRLMREGRFGLFISDLRLPDGDGIEAVAAYLRLYPAGPVIVVTGSPQEGDERRAAELGVREFIYKPFDVGSFERAVLKALE